MLPRVRARFGAWRARFGPRTADVLVILLALAISGGQLIGQPGRDFPLGKAVAWPIIIVAVGALWWRRRWPVAVTLIGCVAVAGTGLAVPALFGLATLAIQRRDRVLAMVAAATYVVLVLVPTLTQHESIWGQALGGVFIVGLFLAFGAYVGARRDLVASLRERAQRAEAERELRAEQAKLGERARIAREMHDVLAHKVSLIALHAGGLELNPDAGPEQVERSAVLIRSTARQALEDLRGVLGVLRADATAEGLELTPQPRLADVVRLVEASRAAGVQVDLETDDAAADAPDPLGRTAYRIVQEGLTNVHKHARGAAATVRLRCAAGGPLEVSVTNLRPVAAGSLLPGSGAGLVGLRERVELSGGRLDAGPQPDGGWRLSAVLPWPVPS
jgi:signal transduction histidine kinase